jgi:NTE family protein
VPPAAAELPYERLMAFWHDNTARLPWEHAWNSWFVNLLRLQDNTMMPGLRVSPYNSSFAWLLRSLMGQAPRKEFLDTQALLEKHVAFAALPGLLKPTSPRLLVGAVDILSGAFRTFDSYKDEITVDALLASAAQPTFSRAVHIGKAAYWEGQFAHNPPLGGFLEDMHVVEKPDEIWIIRVNPTSRQQVPESMSDILDRRSELAGNLSLQQEMHFILKVNKWLGKGFTLAKKKQVKHITLRHISISSALQARMDAASRFDRSQSFIEELIAHGEWQAEQFLNQMDDYVIEL